MNFALFSSNATSVSLCLYTEEDIINGKVSYEITLDEAVHRTGDVWHVAFQDLEASFLYGYRIGGPQNDGSFFRAGLEFSPVRWNESKFVLDVHVMFVKLRAG